MRQIAETCGGQQTSPTAPIAPLMLAVQFPQGNAPFLSTGDASWKLGFFALQDGVASLAEEKRNDRDAVVRACVHLLQTMLAGQPPDEQALAALAPVLREMERHTTPAEWQCIVGAAQPGIATGLPPAIHNDAVFSDFARSSLHGERAQTNATPLSPDQMELLRAAKCVAQLRSIHRNMDESIQRIPREKKPRSKSALISDHVGTALTKADELFKNLPQGEAAFRLIEPALVEFSMGAMEQARNFELDYSCLEVCQALQFCRHLSAARRVEAVKLLNRTIELGHRCHGFHSVLVEAIRCLDGTSGEETLEMLDLIERQILVLEYLEKKDHEVLRISVNRVRLKATGT